MRPMRMKEPAVFVVDRARLSLARSLVAGALLAVGVGLAACGSSPSSTSSAGAAEPTLTYGSPECGQCLAMSLLPSQIHGYRLSYSTFANSSDAATAVASGHIDFAQITYTNFPTLVSKGVDVVATSGEVNGGSDFVVSPSLHLAPDDWSALKSIIAKDKAAGHPFTIASYFGTIQDIELRLLLDEYGIDPSTDVDIVNVPYPGMAQAMHSGSVQAAAPVQPFGREITSDGFGTHFSYMNHQPAGDLTNLVVFNGQFAKTHPGAVLAVDKAMVGLVAYLRTSRGKSAWVDAIERYTNLSSSIILPIMDQFPPDISMSLTKIEQISTAMYADHLLSSPLSTAALRSHIDYRDLAKAAGTTPAAVGA